MKRYLAAALVLVGVMVAVGRAGPLTATPTTVVVSPGTLVASTAPDGWYFWNDRNDIPTGSPGALVSGPASPPAGTGSVELGPLTDGGATGAGHSVIATNRYFGTALASITSLSYDSYQPGPTLAVALQFDVRYRTTDSAYGGRLIFEPYQNGAVTVGSGWQSWSPLAGTWWASKTDVNGTGGSQVVPLPAGNCAISTPCTWAEINAAFPAAAVYGRFLLKAGSGAGWIGFDGNADNLLVGVSGADTLFDFEGDCTTDCYVRPDGNDANTGLADTPAQAKLTIQAAVNQVSAGGTVHVAAGTYVEAGQIVLNKNLTISGDTATKPVVKPAQNTGSSGDARGWILINGGVTANLDHLVLDGTGFNVYQAIRSNGSGTIDQVDVQHIKYAQYVGFGVAMFDDMTVSNSTFTDIERVGVIAFGAGVTGAIIDGNTFTGKGAGDWLDYGVEVGGGAVATITDNVISGNTGVAVSDGSTSAGVLVTTYFGPGTAATLTGNTITGSTAAVAVGYDGTDTSTVVAHQNDFSGNAEGITSTAPAVNATDNWWGSADGPQHASNTFNVATQGVTVSDNVTFVPWLNAAPPAGVSFAPVTDTSPVGSYASIQAGVNASASGGTVNAAAGTFTENVTIATPLTLAGAGQASTTVIPAVSIPNPCAGSSLCGSATAASNIILVQASDVTIHDMTLDGNNPAITSGLSSGGSDLDARNGIVENYYVGAFNNTTVHDVTVKNIYLRGIYMSSGGSGFNLHHNTVQNVQAEYASIAIFNFGGAGTIANNTVADANDAIASNWSRGTQYLNNVVTGSGSGVHTDNAGNYAGSVADLIDGNSVSDCTTNGYGVWTFVQYIQPTVKRNVITNCAVGMAATGSYAGVGTLFEDNEVDGAGLAGSTGLYITTSLFGWGSANVTATLTGNVFKNNADGVFYQSEPTYTLTVDNTGNAVYDNSGTGASKDGTGVFNVKMLGDWWGTDTGPANAGNPSGTGNSVADGIPFSPWLGIGTDASGAPGFQQASPMTWIAGPAVCDVTCIQKAIDFSANGDTVKALSGVFNEHVTLNKAITLTAGSNPIIDGGGSGDGITVTVPNATISSFEVRNVTNGIVVAAGANNATISSNNVHAFHQRGVSLNGATGLLVDLNTIDGEGGGTTASPGSGPDTDTRYYGVFAVDSTGTISNNTITGIRYGVGSGTQAGVGIRLSARSGAAADMTMSGNTLTDIQKGAIVVMNPYGGTAVNASVTGNTVTGNGPISYIAQNGIQVSNGATADVSGNNISGYDYAPSTWAAAGILLVSAGTTSITSNNVHDGHEGIIVQSTNGVSVTGNTLSNIRDASLIVWLGSSNGTYSGNQEAGLGSSTGVYMGDNSTNNTFSGNSFRDNDTGVAVDYNDYGSGTPSGNSFDTNCIAGNASAGMATSGTVGVPVDAENNWWGRVDGPAPAGSGDVIDTPLTIDAVPFLTTPAAGCAAPLAFTTNPGNSTATVAFPTQPVVTIQDAGGNTVTSGPLSTSTVSLAITGPNPSGGVLSGTTSVAAIAGVATFSGLSIDKAGTYTLTATDSDPSLGDAVSASFTISVGPATHLVVAGYPSPTTAGASHGFTVTVMDAGENVVTSYTGTVHFTSTDIGGGTVLPANYAFVGGDAGTHTFAATLTTTGTQSITATDTVSSITGTQPGIVVNPAAATSLLVAGYPSPTIATVAHAFTVTAQDAYGNTDVNYTGTVHFSSSEYSAALPGDYTFVAGDAGTQTFSATMNLPVLHTLTATDTVSSITGSQTGIVVTLLDTDDDGCADVYELGLVPPTNGLDPWDFYSVPVPALMFAPSPLTTFRDSVVGAGDAQAVFSYFKAGAKTGKPVYEQDLNNNGTKDGIEYDRSVVGPGHSGPPDGVVGATDAQLAFAQFKLGYHCNY